MTFPSYTTGTVAVPASGTTITGSGCNWSGLNAKPGDDIVIAGNTVIVQDVVDSTHITIDPWPYTAVAAGTAYKLVQRSPLRFAGGDAMAAVSQLVSVLNTDGFYVFVPSAATAPDPSYGEDGQYAFQAATGKLWQKTSGAWLFIGVYKGFGTPAPYDNSHTYGLMDVATSGGSSYVYINSTPSSGNAPPNATYWAVLASIGATGAAGANGAAGSPGAPGANAPTYGGTSTTSITIGTGTQAFATQSGLAYQNGARVRAANTADATKWVEGVVTYSGTTLTIAVDKMNGTGTFASWNFNVAGQPGSGDLSSANALSELTSVAATARANIGVPQVFGQCRLVLSGGNLVLKPFNGNILTINGQTSAVPNAGVSLAATGLTAGTLYYIYAYNNAGTMTLEASTTGHATSTVAGNLGIEIKSGDSTRTLVGMAQVVTGPAWADSATQAFVVSYFNRSGKGLANHITATRSTSSTTFVEMHSEVRCEFLTWADEIVEATVIGSGYPGAGSVAVFAAVGFDGTTAEDGMAAISDGTGGSLRPVAATAARRLSEGYHYATILGASGGAASFNLYWFSANNGFRSGLAVTVRG